LIRSYAVLEFPVENSDVYLINLLAPSPIAVKEGDNSAVKLNEKEFDLKIQVISSLESKKYTIRISVLEPSDGLILRESELFEAPQDGYVAEATIPIQFHSVAKAVWLYTKTRQPPVYGRTEIKLSATEKRLNIWLHGEVNPYGDRSLDLEPMLSEAPRVYTDLDQDVKNLFRNHTRPVKPDLRALVEEDKRRRTKSLSRPATQEN